MNALVRACSFDGAHDQVGGEGEQRAHVDQRVSDGDQLADGHLQEGQPVGLQGWQGVDVGDRAHRRHATTGPTLDLISTSIPATTSGSTMSEKRIAASAVPSDRLQGDLGDEVGGPGRRRASPSPRGARYSGSERPATAHEPHGRPAHRQAARGADQVGIGGQATSDGEPRNPAGSGGHDWPSSQTSAG